jgi:acyl-CoA thioester hydrolase
MDWTETTFHVRYAETDAMGVVHHSVYIVWFEEGRSHTLRSRGSSYADLEAAGYDLAVSEVEARYVAPARYGQQVTVRTGVESVRSRSISMVYEVLEAASGRLLVTGRTKHICINDEGKVVAIPEAWRRKLAGEGSNVGQRSASGG